MTCVLFPKTNEVFSLKNKTIKEYWKKILVKSGNFACLEKWKPWFQANLSFSADINAHLKRPSEDS